MAMSTPVWFAISMSLSVFASRLCPSQKAETRFAATTKATTRCLLSEVLPPTSRNFQLANQIGLLQFRATIDSYLEGVRFANPDTPVFARIALANYFAGAVLMPYESFLDAAKTARHDVDILENRFGVSFEQVCHRLIITTLQRPGARGVPLHFVRVDIAREHLETILRFGDPDIPARRGVPALERL